MTNHPNRARGGKGFGLRMPAGVADREKVAAMMMRLSIARGHGDTIDDLLSELEAEIAKRQRPDGNGWKLAALLDDAGIVEKVCRQIDIYDGNNPDEPLAANPGFKLWELHVAEVKAALRALRALVR